MNHLLKNLPRADIKWYTIQECAEILSISPRRVREYIEDGRLYARKLGRQMVVPDPDLHWFSVFDYHGKAGRPLKTK